MKQFTGAGAGFYSYMDVPLEPMDHEPSSSIIDFSDSFHWVPHDYTRPQAAINMTLPLAQRPSSPPL